MSAEAILTMPEHRRSTDDDAELAGHVRGLQISWRVIEVGIIVLGFGITIGVNVQKFNNLNDRVTDLSKSITEIRKDTTDASVTAQVAQKTADDQKRKMLTMEFEMGQWRAVMEAIAMIQGQGGDRVTINIPQKPKEKEKEQP